MQFVDDFHPIDSDHEEMPPKPALLTVEESTHKKNHSANVSKYRGREPKVTRPEYNRKDVD